MRWSWTSRPVHGGSWSSSSCGNQMRHRRKKRTKNYRSIALALVMSKVVCDLCYSSSVKRRSLKVGNSCMWEVLTASVVNEHLEVMMTLLLHNHWVHEVQEDNDEARQREETNEVPCQHGHQDGVWRGETEASCVHWWITAALFRAMAGLEDQTTFRKPTQYVPIHKMPPWRKWRSTTAVAQNGNARSWGMSSRSGREKRWAPHWQCHHICSFMWADNYWIISHSKAQRWDLEPKPAGLWWTSTCAHEMDDITLSTRAGHHKVPLEKCFKTRTCSSTKEKILPHNDTIPTSRGKIGVVGNVGIIQTHQQDGKIKDICFSIQLLRAEDRSTRAKGLGTRHGFGWPKGSCWSSASLSAR